MDNLRWILIFAGVAILVLLYFSGRPRRPAASREPGERFQRGKQAGPRGGDVDPLMGEADDQLDEFGDLDPDDMVRPGSAGRTAPQSRRQSAGRISASDTGLDDQRTDSRSGDSRAAQPDGQHVSLAETGFAGSGGALGRVAARVEALTERLSPKRRQLVAESGLDESTKTSDGPGNYASKILTLHVSASSGYLLDGAQLLEVLERRGYHFGEMNIFHLMHQGKTLFSVVKMVEPGYFDIDNIESFQTPGITFLLQLPGPAAADVAFELLIDEATEMAAELNAALLDSGHSTLTRQTIQHLREGIYEYMHRQKYFSSVPS